MLKSLQEGIDTGNPTGKLIFHILEPCQNLREI